jgi:hypothetical protein
MKRILFIVSGFLLTSWVLTGCSPKSSDTTPPATKLMFVHASAKTPSLDFFISNGYENFRTVAINQAYQSTSGYLTATAGTYAVLADTTNQVDNNILLGQYIGLSGGGGYSFFIVDSSAAVTRSILIGEDLTKAGADSAGIRFFHFAPGAPKLDVFISNTTTPDFSNRDLLYLESSDAKLASTKFGRVFKGDHTITIREAGTTNTLYSFNATFTATKLYTLFVSGFTTETGDKAFSAKLIVNE